jgi:hypothetical protein
MKPFLLLVFTPLLAFGITIVNQFGSIAVVPAGINQVTSIKQYQKIVANLGTSLGSETVVTGPLLSGSVIGGGVFDNTGSSLTFVGNGNQNSPVGVIFSGTFNTPLTWTKQSINSYSLTGTADGNFLKGQNARAVFLESFTSFTDTEGDTTYSIASPATTVITLLGPQKKKK